jgi:protein-tyrosine-phosphatase
MSKIVARKAFGGRALPFAIRFESMAAIYGNRVGASKGARNAVAEAFGEDLLASHRVMKQNEGIIDDADLILIMEDKLRAGLPPQKTQLITKFFGSKGQIENPWPDSTKDAEQKYRKCLAQLRSLIEPKADLLIKALEPRGSSHNRV